MIDTCSTSPDIVGEIAALMRLLGDATRIRILSLLKHGEKNVSTLCGDLDLAQPTVSHHLGLLRTAGLLVTRRAGKQVYYSLNATHILANEVDGSLSITHGRIGMSFGRLAQGDPAVS